MKNLFVIYLLSQDYYKSVACLNEMGAAWVVENDHAMIFTPNFDLRCYEFQNGALDPREMGFYINNENRLISFAESLRSKFPITRNNVLINQKVKWFIEIIKFIINNGTELSSNIFLKPDIFEKAGPEMDLDNEMQGKKEIEVQSLEKIINVDGKSRFYVDLIKGKLKDEEVLLAKYIIDTERFKLCVGWQESYEIDKIKIWEDINDIKNTLSSGYNGVMKRFEMKKLIQVSDTTSHGNPKEMCLIESFANELLYPSKVLLDKIQELIEAIRKDQIDQLPF